MNTCCGKQDEYSVPPSRYFNLGDLPQTSKSCYCPCLSYYGKRSVRDLMDRSIYMEKKPDLFWRKYDYC